MAIPASLLQTLTKYHLQPYPSFTGLPQPVSASSIAHFLGALIWVWLLLVSFTGWGSMTCKMLRVRSLPASASCALGIAIVVFLGGLLNLLHAIYAAVLFAITGLGILFYLLLRSRRPKDYRWAPFWSNAGKWSRLVVVLTLLILVLRVVATVRLGEFRVEDDGSAYLVFPQKMLATHRFAPDPFSDRRVISSLGGSYLLQAMVIAATSLPHIGMADRTFGLVLLFFSLLDLGLAFGLSPPQIAALELIAYLVPQETFNLTFSILPIALLLTMVWTVFMTLEATEDRRWQYAAFMGAAGGAVIALKSTYLPYVGALALLPYVLLFRRKKWADAVRLPAVAGLAALVVTFAWMISMKSSSGTYLFPVLGHGFDYSSYGILQAVPRFTGRRAILRVFPQGIALLILAAVQFLSERRDLRSQLSFSVLVSSALAITAFNYESGADYIWRYNFPQFFTAILVFFAAEAAVFRIAPLSFRTRMGYIVATVSLIGCIFYYDVEGGRIEPFQRMAIESRLYRRNLRASLSGMQLVSPAIRQRYRQVEDALPPGAVALDVTTDSFLLTGRDHRRILLDDWPGAASPPPGWPFSVHPNAVPALLAHNSVRYVVYGYDYANWFDMRSCGSIPNEAHSSGLDHALQVLSLLTHHQLDQLRATYRSVYDDGQIAVIDLNSPIVPPLLPGPAWSLHTSEGEMCSTIVRRYLTVHPRSTSF